MADVTVTSTALVQAPLDRTAATRPTLNAFRRTRPEAALAEAAEADRRLAQGERLPLLGVPLAVKDDTNVAGLAIRFGWAGGIQGQLLRAGPVALRRRPRLRRHTHPWNTGHIPGGSAGGSTEAVAAGFVPAALGSDETRCRPGART